ncbi:MAG: Ig-like domain-containing protein [Candidatus Nezhaarchaeales archaeon]
MHKLFRYQNILLIIAITLIAFSLVIASSVQAELNVVSQANFNETFSETFSFSLANLTLKVYPDGGVAPAIDVIIPPLEDLKGSLKFDLYVSKASAYTYLNLKLPQESLTESPPLTADLSFEYHEPTGHGLLNVKFLKPSRDAPAKSVEATIDLYCQELEKNTKITINYRIEFDLQYLTQEEIAQLQQVSSLIQLVKPSLKEAFSETIHGALSLDDINMNFDANRGVLEGSIEISGDFEEAASLQLKRPFELPYYAPYYSEELERMADLLSTLIDRLENVRYMKITDINLQMSLSTETGLLELLCEVKFTGDITKQMTETIRTIASWAIEYSEELNLTEYQDVINAIKEFIYDPTTIQVHVEYPTERGFELHVVGVKVIYEKEPSQTLNKIHDILQELIEHEPKAYKEMRIAIAPGSTSHEEVEIELPSQYMNSTKIVEGKYEIGSNLQILSHMQFKVKPNKYGVADYRIIKSKLNITLATNSTVVEHTFNEDLGVLNIEVQGAPGSLGAMNITIPKDIVASQNATTITVKVDGQKVNTIISEDNENYYVYFTYEHSTHTIEIVFSRLHSIQIQAPQQAAAESPIEITITCLDQTGTPLSGITITLYLDGEQIATLTTGLNGQATYTLTLKEGQYTLNAQADGITGITTITAIPQSPIPLIIATIVVIMILASILAILKKRDKGTSPTKEQL